MNETIAALLKLQELDLAVESFRRDKEALLPRRAKIQDDKKALLAAFEDSKKSLNQAQLDRKRLEGEAEAKEQAARKHTAELNAVKGNDAYKALLVEIEAARKEKAAIEDKVLEVMELQDRLQKDLREREKTLDADKAALDAKARAVDEEEKALDAALAAKSSERAAYAAPLPPEALKRYDAVRRGRAGFAALAEAKDMACQGCRTKLPPDVVNRVMKGAEVVLCESCSRILFVRPAPKAAPAA